MNTLFASVQRVAFFALLLTGLTSSVFAAEGSAKSSVPTVLVFDASGSMWNRDDGVIRYEAAADAVSAIMQSQGPGSELGLIAYGHRRKGSCSDIELLVSPQAGTADRIVSEVNKLSPIGKTPLTASIRQAAEQLGWGERAARVIVVTDGLETCGQDPCQAAKDLEAAGLNFEASVVGLGLKGTNTESLQCIADNTGGKFVKVDNIADLGDGLEEVFDTEPAGPTQAELDQQELEALRNQLAQLLAEKEAANDELDRVYRESDAFNVDLAQAQDQAVELSNEVARLRDLLAELRDALAKANAENARLRNELKGANAANSKLEEDLAAANLEIARLLDELAAAEAEVARLKAALDKANAEIKRLSDALAKANEVNARLANELDKANAENARLANELDKANAENARLANELADAQSQIADLSDKLSRAEAEIARLQDENAKLKADNTKLKADNAQLSGENAILRDKNAGLQEALAASGAEIANLKQALQDCQDNNSKLSSSLAQCQADKQSLQSDWDAFKNASDEDMVFLEEALRQLTQVRQNLDDEMMNIMALSDLLDQAQQAAGNINSAVSDNKSRTAIMQEFLERLKAQ